MVKSPYVKIEGIGKLVTTENLNDLFECCGVIKEIKITSGNSRLIEFSDHEQAETAIMLDGTVLGDEKLKVRICDLEEAGKLNNKKVTNRATSEYEKAVIKMREMMAAPEGSTKESLNRIPDEVKRTIYVGNVPQMATEYDLKKFFEKVGNAMYVKLQGNTGHRYAFVEFETENGAKNAFTMEGCPLQGSPVKIRPSTNTIFKSDFIKQSSMSQYTATRNAKLAAERLKNRIEGKSDDRHGKRRDRKRRRRRRKRRKRERSRSRERRRKKYSSDEEDDDDSDDGPKPGQMFWDGFQWHTNPEHDMEEVESRVTSIIRDTSDSTGPKPKLPDMKSEALKSLKSLNNFSSFQKV